MSTCSLPFSLFPLSSLYTLSLSLSLSFSYIVYTHGLHTLSNLFCRFKQHPALILIQSWLHRQNMPSTGGKLIIFTTLVCVHYVLRSSNCIPE